jgi:hypothetical protein
MRHHEIARGYNTGRLHLDTMPLAPQPLVLPRGLIFLACLWLIASWALSIGVRMPVQPSSATFEPGVRMLLFCAGLGLMIGWPLLRLSQRPLAEPAKQVMLDLVALLALLQVAVWLPRILTIWTPSRTAAIDAMLGGWAVLAGAIVASAAGSPRMGPRNLAMLACVAMCALGPAAIWLGFDAGMESARLLLLGPLMGVLSLATGGSTAPTLGQWHALIVLWAAAVTAWIALGALRRFSNSRTDAS